VEQVQGRYKVFRNLPASPTMPLTAADASSSGKSDSAAAPLRVLAPTRAGGFSHSAIMFLARDPESASGAAAGMLAINGKGVWEGLQTADDYQALLARQFPGLPAEWLPEVRLLAGLAGCNDCFRGWQLRALEAAVLQAACNATACSSGAQPGSSSLPLAD